LRPALQKDRSRTAYDIALAKLKRDSDKDVLALRRHTLGAEKNFA
jgi:hypothetical protein